MPLTITVTDIDIGREYRVYAEDDAQGTTHVYATISASMMTAAGIAFRKSKTMELTGTVRTRAVALFQDLKDMAKAEEGVA